jgi:hypothetical protein
MIDRAREDVMAPAIATTVSNESLESNGTVCTKMLLVRAADNIIEVANADRVNGSCISSGHCRHYPTSWHCRSALG